MPRGRGGGGAPGILALTLGLVGIMRPWRVVRVFPCVALGAAGFAADRRLHSGDGEIRSDAVITEMSSVPLAAAARYGQLLASPPGG